jgi:hypothetical protein
MVSMFNTIQHLFESSDHTQIAITAQQTSGSESTSFLLPAKLALEMANGHRRIKESNAQTSVYQHVLLRM